MAQAPLLPSAHTRTFCALAADLGYPSRGYKLHTGGCASDMKDVTPVAGSNGLNNNLAFYAMGDINKPEKLKRVSLILNINNPKEQTKAQAELSRVAIGVARKIIGKEPADLDAVIRNSSSKKWISGKWSIEIKTTKWPTGKGQDTTVHFRPSK